MTVGKIVKTLCKAALVFSAGYFVGRIVTDKEWEDIMDDESNKFDDDDDDDFIDDEDFMCEDECSPSYTTLNASKSLHDEKMKEAVDWIVPPKDDDDNDLIEPDYDENAPVSWITIDDVENDNPDEDSDCEYETEL